MSNALLTDIIGYSALVINLFSMSRKRENQLRIISAVANFLYIIYGILLSALPIVIGCAIAVGLHLYRLRNLKTKA